jgi:hypothetical protein
MKRNSREAKQSRAGMIAPIGCEFRFASHEFLFEYEQEEEPTSAKGFEPIHWVHGFDCFPSMTNNTEKRFEL